MRKNKRHSSRSASLGSKSSQTTLFTAGVEIETRRITTTTSRHGSSASIPMTDLNFCGSAPPSAVLPSELGPTVEVSLYFVSCPKFIYFWFRPKVGHQPLSHFFLLFFLYWGQFEINMSERKDQSKGGGRARGRRKRIMK